MKYGIISFSAPGSTQKKNCHLSSNRQSLLRSQTATSHAARLTFFTRRRARRGFAHSWRVWLLISTNRLGRGIWNLLGLLTTIQKWKRADSKSTIFITLLQFFQILPPKITQKFQLLRLATSKTPHGTPRVFVTTVPSSPPPKWSPVSQLSLPNPGWEQSALPTGSATSQRWVGIGETACHMTKMPFQRQDTAGMYSPRCDI